MDERRVVITGIGVVTPVGNSTQEFWDSICEGRVGVEKITLFDPSAYPTQIAAEVKGFDPCNFISPKEVKRMDRFTHFALAAASMAIEDAGIDWEKVDRNRMGALLGSGIGGLRTIEDQQTILLKKGPNRVSPFLIPMLITDIAPGHIAMRWKLRGVNLSISTACASSAHALGISARTIQRGDADIIIAGGSEAAITPLGLAGFCNMRALSTLNQDPQKASRPFDRLRDGFVMGEGAGILILEELNHALRRNASIYAEVVGFGMSADAYHVTAPEPGGEGARLAMKGALEDAGINPEDVDYINAHGTSTPLNDKFETIAIKKVFGEKAKQIAVSSTKSMTGHMLGAAGGIEAAVCALAVKYDIIPPTMNYEHPDPECDLDYVPNEARKKKVKVAVSNSFGFGGHNAVLVIKKFEV